MVDMYPFLLVNIIEWNITSVRPLNSWCLWCCKIYTTMWTILTPKPFLTPWISGWASGGFCVEGVTGLLVRVVGVPRWRKRRNQVLNNCILDICLKKVKYLRLAVVIALFSENYLVWSFWEIWFSYESFVRSSYFYIWIGERPQVCMWRHTPLTHAIVASASCH